MPVSHVLMLERPEKPARAERGDERFLDDVFREIGVAELQLGDSHQIAAVPVELDGEKRSVQTAPVRSSRK